MDIDLTRTFLEILRCGSFIAAAERLHLTQTAITARVQKLEGHLGCSLFVRNRAGARLTADGEAFAVHARQILQTWEAAQQELPLPSGFRHILRLGGETSLCTPLMLRWVSRIRTRISQYAVHSLVGDDHFLHQQLEHGLLDAALLYQPPYWSGLQVEQLLEEKLVLVTTAEPAPYVYVDWGPAFRQQHDSALPDKAAASLSFNLGPLALQYILEHGGSGYFRARVVQHYLDSQVLQRVARAPEFSYPTYLAYPRERDSDTLQRSFQLLRELISEDPDWSQRWDPCT